MHKRNLLIFGNFLFGFALSAQAAGPQIFDDTGRPLKLESAPRAEPADPYRLKLPDPAQYRLQGATVVSPEPATPPVPEVTGDMAQRPYHREVLKAASEFRIDPALVHAVIKVESGYNPAAVSPKGALGLMQLLPDTARRFGVTNPEHLNKPDRNIRAGVAYLRALMQMFNDDTALVLAAYNAGEGAVMRYGNKIPPFPETRDYVPRVMEIYNQLRPAPPPVADNGPAPRLRIQYPPPRPEATVE